MKEHSQENRDISAMMVLKGRPHISTKHPKTHQQPLYTCTARNVCLHCWICSRYCQGLNNIWTKNCRYMGKPLKEGFFSERLRHCEGIHPCQACETKGKPHQSTTDSFVTLGVKLGNVTKHRSAKGTGESMWG